MSKSAFRFQPEMRQEHAEPSRGSSLPGNIPFRNVSGEDTNPFQVPRRPQVRASDRFAADYVEGPGTQRQRGRSGRLLPRRDTPIPAGTRPGPDERHDARLHRAPGEVAKRRREAEAGGPDWSEVAAPPNSWALRNGCQYPAAFRAAIEEF
jgi:hypothetical protein